LCILCFNSYIYPLYQIDNFSWIDQNHINQCSYRIIDDIKEYQTYQFHEKISKQINMICSHTDHKPIIINMIGQIDLITNNQIIKYFICHNNQHFNNLEHLSQLIINLWITDKLNGYIFNPNQNSKININIINKSDFDKYMED